MTTTVLTPHRRLPDGFTVRLREDLLVTGGGRVLIGGSPIRAVKLSDRAKSLLVDGRLVVDGSASDLLAARLLDGNLADPVLTEPSAPPRDITVVVPVRDRPEQLDRCLVAVRPLSCVVVDDQSLRPDLVAAVAARHRATLVSLRVNVGPAGARNAGLRRVRTPYVAFVDSDVTVDADTLGRLARHFADDQVALVGPRIRSITSAQPRWHERFDAHSSSLDLSGRSCSVMPGAAVAWLPGACLVGRVDRLGAGFDQELRVGEDVDLVWRLIAEGQVVRYDPTETAGHDARPTLRGWLGRKFVYGTGGAVLAARHGDRCAVAALSPVAAAAAAALLARRWWSLPVAAAALLHSRRGLFARLPEDAERGAVATALAYRGLGWAVRQETALLLRHWWPATAVGAAISPCVRRAVVSALAVDAIVAWSERCSDSGPRFTCVSAGRRLDDLAYGSGLWWGALQARSPRALLPRRPNSPRPPR